MQYYTTKINQFNSNVCLWLMPYDTSRIGIGLNLQYSNEI